MRRGSPWASISIINSLFDNMRLYKIWNALLTFASLQTGRLLLKTERLLTRIGTRKASSDKRWLCMNSVRKIAYGSSGAAFGSSGGAVVMETQTTDRKVSESILNVHTVRM